MPSSMRSIRRSRSWSRGILVDLEATVVVAGSKTARTDQWQPHAIANISMSWSTTWLFDCVHWNKRFGETMEVKDQMVVM